MVNIEDFKGLDIKIDYDEAIKDLAETCKDDIVSIANSNKWNDYANGWVVGKKRDRTGTSYIVHNKDNYRLTHLLENGHLIVNKRNGVGWASPRPHIKPSFDKAYRQMDSLVGNKIKLVDKER